MASSPTIEKAAVAEAYVLVRRALICRKVATSVRKATNGQRPPEIAARYNVNRSTVYHMLSGDPSRMAGKSHVDLSELCLAFGTTPGCLTPYEESKLAFIVLRAFAVTETADIAAWCRFWRSCEASTCAQWDISARHLHGNWRLPWDVVQEIPLREELKVTLHLLSKMTRAPTCNPFNNALHRFAFSPFGDELLDCCRLVIDKVPDGSMLAGAAQIVQLLTDHLHTPPPLVDDQGNVIRRSISLEHLFCSTEKLREIQISVRSELWSQMLLPLRSIVPPSNHLLRKGGSHAAK